MAISSGKDPFWTAKRGIVQNGLVLNLDAAVTQSYPGTGTVWRDLSGFNNHGTLTNGPVYNRNNGGAIDFDGTDDYVSTGINGMSELGNTSDFTFCIFANIRQAKYLTFMQLQKVYYVATLGMGAFNDRRWYFSYGNSTIGPYRYLTLNKWYYLCVVRLGQDLLYYENGVSVGSTLSYSFASSSVSAFTLGSGLSVLQNGQISNVQIYNRALSASEIAQNFNVTRNRFGV